MFFFDGSTIAQISATATASTRPKISGSRVVWSENDGNDEEIFLFDSLSGQVTQLTDNEFDDVSPQIDGQNAVWVSRATTDRISFYDGNSVHNVAFGSRFYSPSISGQNIAWERDSVSGSGVFLYDGVEVMQLSDNDVSDVAPTVSGNIVAWMSGEFGARDIIAYDGATTTQLTSDGMTGVFPNVSGNRVVWRGSDGTDDEIYLATLVPEPQTLTLAIVLGLFTMQVGRETGARELKHDELHRQRESRNV